MGIVVFLLFLVALYVMRERLRSPKVRQGALILVMVIVLGLAGLFTQTAVTDAQGVLLQLALLLAIWLVALGFISLLLGIMKHLELLFWKLPSVPLHFSLLGYGGVFLGFYILFLTVIIVAVSSGDTRGIIMLLLILVALLLVSGIHFIREFKLIRRQH